MLVCALAPIAASAQSSAADRIDAIERQIHSMETELRQLKQELRQSRSDAARAREETRQAREAAARATAAEAQPTEAAARAQAFAAAPPPSPGPPPNPAPHVVQTPGNRFGLESADGRNSIYLTGRLHFDVGDYLEYHPDSKFASVQNLNSGVNARRARLGVTGKFAGDWTYNFIYDFGGSSDAFPPTSGAPASGIEAAYLTYNGFNKGPLPLAFDLGYMDTPFTLAEATSSNDILFMERPSITVVAMSLFAGDNRSAFGVRSNDDNYWLGAYATGPTSGSAHVTGESFGAFGRGTYQLVQTPEASLHIGAGIGALLHAPGSPASVTLSDRPELRIDPTTMLSTGALGTAAVPVLGAQVYGVEAAAGWRNLFAQGEYYHIDVDRLGLASNGFDGGYVEASWTVTGESRKYNPAAGVYGSIVPDRPFEPWSDNYDIGAWELAFRYSTIDLNDNFKPGMVPAATSNAVGGGKQTVYGVGLNWYPNANIRFMLDYLHGNIDKKFSTAAGGGIAGTPLGTPVGGSFDALAMRMQFAF